MEPAPVAAGAVEGAVPLFDPVPDDDVVGMAPAVGAPEAGDPEPAPVGAVDPADGCVRVGAGDGGGVEASVRPAARPPATTTATATIATATTTE